MRPSDMEREVDLERRLETLQQRLVDLERQNTELVRAFEDATRFNTFLAEFRPLRSEETVFAKACDIATGLLPVRSAQILRLDPASGRFRPVAPAEPPLPVAFEEVLDHNVLKWCFSNSLPSTVPSEREELAAAGLRNFVLVPIGTPERAIAVLVLAAAGEAHGLDRFSMDLLGNLGRETTAAVENLRLASRVQGLVTLLDNVLESVPHAIIAVGRDDKVIACNENAEFMFDFRRFLAIGERYQDVFPESLSTIFSSLIVNTLQGQETRDFEFEHQVRNATITIGFSTNLLVDKAGEPYGLVFICRDLSLSREVQKLRELDQMKSEFVQTVSHELKTPLTAILGGTEILLLDQDKLDESQMEVVQIIDDGAKRLQALISDLLDLSRLESGKITLDEEEVNLSEIIEETALLLAPKDGRHTVVVDIPADGPLLYLDRAKMKQVLENLIGNAIKYSPAGGTVEARLVHEAHQARLVISDEGIGIPPEHLERIWDKFYRVDSSTTAEIEGTGLGLAIVKHIIEMHGGSVSVQSNTPGRKGSIFTILLPFKERPLDEF